MLKIKKQEVKDINRNVFFRFYCQKVVGDDESFSVLEVEVRQQLVVK